MARVQGFAVWKNWMPHWLRSVLERFCLKEVKP